MDCKFDIFDKLGIMIASAAISAIICAIIYSIKSPQNLSVVTAIGEEMTGTFRLIEWRGSTWVQLEDGTKVEIVKYKKIK